jgi:hypothetical protein
MALLLSGCAVLPSQSSGVLDSADVAPFLAEVQRGDLAEASKVGQDMFCVGVEIPEHRRIFADHKPTVFWKGIPIHIYTFVIQDGSCCVLTLFGFQGTVTDFVIESQNKSVDVYKSTRADAG